MTDITPETTPTPTITTTIPEVTPAVTTEIQADVAETEIVGTDIKSDIRKLYDVIDAWFIKHFHNSPVSRDAAVINHVIAAKDDLKATISKI